MNSKKNIVLAFIVLACFSINAISATSLDDMGTVFLRVINNSGNKVKLKVYSLSFQNTSFEVDVRSKVSLLLNNVVRVAAVQRDALIPDGLKRVWRIEFVEEGMQSPVLAFENKLRFMNDGGMGSIGSGYATLPAAGGSEFLRGTIITKFSLGLPDSDEGDSEWSGIEKKTETPFVACQSEDAQAVVDQFVVTIVLDGKHLEGSIMEVESLEPVLVINKKVMELAEKIIQIWS